MSDLPPPPPSKNLREAKINKSLVAVVVILVLALVGLGGFMIGGETSQVDSIAAPRVSTSAVPPSSTGTTDAVGADVLAWVADFEKELSRMQSDLEGFNVFSAGWFESTALFDSAYALIEEAFDEAPKAPDGLRWDSWLELQDAVKEFEGYYSLTTKWAGELAFEGAHGRRAGLGDNTWLMDWWVQYYRPPGAVASGAVGVIESFLDVMADVS